MFKGLKNIEDENEELLIIKNKTENIKEITNFFWRIFKSRSKSSLIEEIRIIQKDVNYRKLKIIGGHNVAYNFSDFKTINDLFKAIRLKKK